MSHYIKLKFVTLFSLLLGVGVSTAIAEEPRIKFPTDYKATLINYLSLDRTLNENQIIRLFAPKAALDAAKSDKQVPDGTVLVGEIYKAKLSSNGEVIESALGRRVRGKLAAIAVMQKQKGWSDRYPDELKTGDWDFAVFSVDGKRLVKKDLNKCRSCHAPLKDTQHLFSLEHMKN